MKKLSMLFAVLVVASMSMVQAENMNSLNEKGSLSGRITEPKDSIDVVCSNANFKDYGNKANRFYFSGVSDDSIYSISTDITRNFAAGSYNDSVLKKSNCYVKTIATGESVYLENGLSDVVVTIDSSTGITYYNLKYRFVGRDSVLYKLDMTYHKPYEKYYYEAVTTSLSIDTSEAGRGSCQFSFEDAGQTPKYKYLIGMRPSLMSQTEITVSDTAQMLVTDYNNPDRPLYMSYSGQFTLTKVNDSTYTIVGQILCNGDMNFYLNCKHPTAVENVTVSELNVYSETQAIILNGVESQNIAIYDVNGRLVYNTVVTTDTARFAVPAAGIYVVRVNDKVAKVIVK